MKKRIRTFTLHILDIDHRPVKDARVILKSEHEEFMLFRESEKGYYSSEKDIPKGEYTLTVLKKPFEQDSRKVTTGELPGYDVFAALTGMSFRHEKTGRLTIRHVSQLSIDN